MIAVGDKVVCIDDRIRCSSDSNSGKSWTYLEPSSGLKLPGGHVKKNEIYCISGFHVSAGGNLQIKLVGHPVLLWGQEIGWNPKRFRKIESLSERNIKSKEVSISS